MTYERSHIAAVTTKELLDVTVGQLLRRTAEQSPDVVALIDGAGDFATRGRWTYQELLEQAEIAAAALLSVFRPGEHVAIFGPNSPEWTFVQLGAALAGLVLVTVNPVLRPVEVRHVLGQSDSVGVIAADRHRGQDLVTMVESLHDELPSVREVIRLDDWVGFCARAVIRKRQALPALNAQDSGMIQYTSGTMGAPKGAVLHHYGLVNAGRFIAERIERQAGYIWLNPLPLFHTGGCVMGTLGAMASSGTLIVMREFDPALMLRLIEEERPSYAIGVPTMIIALLEHRDFATRDTSSLRLFSWATTVRPDLVRRIESEFNVTYNMVMGQTESSSVIFMTRLDSTTQQKGQTLGVPLLHWETKIADEQGSPMAIGEAGELCVRGWGVMKGYYNLPEATAVAIDSDGWLHTGDIATMDADGFTAITGRIKDMIIRSGVLRSL